MNHWELAACVDDFLAEHKTGPTLQPPTDEEFDAWAGRH